MIVAINIIFYIVMLLVALYMLYLVLDKASGG